MTAGKFFGVAALTFALLLGVTLLAPYRNENTEARIARVCQEDYGRQGFDAVQQCRVVMMARLILERRQDQRDATYGRVR